MTDLDIEQHEQGAILPVRAAAGAGRNGIRGEQGGALKVAVTQVAERGKANKAIVAVLSKALGVSKSQIELVSGATSNKKRFLFHDLSPDDLRRRVEGAITSD